MLGVEMVSIDGPANVCVVIIDVNLFVVPAELVCEGCPQTPGSDNGNPTCIQIKIQHDVVFPPVAGSACFIVISQRIPSGGTPECLHPPAAFPADSSPGFNIPASIPGVPIRKFPPYCNRDVNPAGKERRNGEASLLR
jgi:hypothetical protein